MDLIQIIETLSWPTAIVALGFLFKKPLSELIKKTQNIEYRKSEDRISNANIYC